MHTMNINYVSSVDQILYREDEVHSVVDGDSVFLAMIDPHATGNYQFDGCGVARVDWDGVNFDPEPCHDTCASYYENSALDRMREAFYGVDDDWRDNADSFEEAIFKVAKRANVSIAGLSSSNYGVSATRILSANDINGCYKLLIASKELRGDSPDAAYNFAKLDAAECNNQTWVVGKMPRAKYDEMIANGESVTPLDCDEVVHGFIWANVDSDGDSSPTADELVNCI